MILEHLLKWHMVSLSDAKHVQTSPSDKAERQSEKSVHRDDNKLDGIFVGILSQTYIVLGI